MLRGTDLCGPPQAQSSNSLSRVPPGVGASGLEAAPPGRWFSNPGAPGSPGRPDKPPSPGPWISGWGQGRSQGHLEARTCQGF